MKVLVLNCGSSSIKYQLIDMKNENLMAKGYLEKIGLPDSFLTHTVNGEKHKIEQVIENHEEDLPMFCQYEEDYGFGFWHDIYDEHSLGFVDSEFKTNEELGYEKVIAWQPLPQPFQTKGE